VNTIDWPPSRQPRRRGRLLLVGAIALILFGIADTLFGLRARLKLPPAPPLGGPGPRST